MSPHTWPWCKEDKIAQTSHISTLSCIRVLSRPREYSKSIPPLRAILLIHNQHAQLNIQDKLDGRWHQQSIAPTSEAVFVTDNHPTESHLKIVAYCVYNWYAYSEWVLRHQVLNHKLSDVGWELLDQSRKFMGCTVIKMKANGIVEFW